jgi:hypothetical protein
MTSTQSHTPPSVFFEATRHVTRFPVRVRESHRVLVVVVVVVVTAAGAAAPARRCA